MTTAQLHYDELLNLPWGNLPWGTYGIEGKGPLQWKKLGELSTSHLKAILTTQKHINPVYYNAIKGIIEIRQIPTHDAIIIALSEIDPHFTFIRDNETVLYKSAPICIINCEGNILTICESIPPVVNVHFTVASAIIDISDPLQFPEKFKEIIRNLL